MPASVQEAESSQSRAKGNLRSKRRSDQRPREKSLEGSRDPYTILGLKGKTTIPEKGTGGKKSKTVALKMKIFQLIIQIENQGQKTKLKTINSRRAGNLSVLHHHIPHTTRHTPHTVQ